MRRAENLFGRTFGDWSVVKRAQSRSGIAYWWCRCKCGRQREVRGNALTSGDSLSCGCWKRDTGGLANTKTGHIWAKMLRRCENPADSHYHRYGGRGIKVCERWHSLVNFVADMGMKPEGLSIDRINNDGDYEPGNCRWATPQEQCRNTMRTRILTFNNKSQCMAAWSEELGISQDVIERRLNQCGWSVERTLSTPVQPLFGDPWNKLKGNRA